MVVKSSMFVWLIIVNSKPTRMVSLIISSLLSRTLISNSNRHSSLLYQVHSLYQISAISVIRCNHCKINITNYRKLVRILILSFNSFNSNNCNNSRIIIIRICNLCKLISNNCKRKIHLFIHSCKLLLIRICLILRLLYLTYCVLMLISL